MPGGPGKIGVTTITGRYIQDPSGVLNINLDVAHPAMSKLIVTSNAPMAGTIFITPINLATAKVATSTFTVFHADDGVDPIEGEPLKLAFKPSALLSYSMTVQGPDIMVTYGVDYSPDAFGTHGNLFQVGSDFDRLRTSGNSAGFNALTTQFFAIPTVGDLAATYETLSGEGAAGVQQTAFQADDLYLQAARGEARQTIAGGAGATPNERVGQSSLWATGYGSFATMGGDPKVGSGRLDIDGGGMEFGAQSGGRGAVIGVDAGFDDSGFSVASRYTNGTVQGAHVGLYAAASHAGFYALSQIDGDFFTNRVSRQIGALGLAELTAARFSSEGLTARLEVGRAFDLAAVRVTPFVAVQDSFIDVSAYREAATSGGDLFALGYGSREVDLPEFGPGLRVAGRLAAGRRADALCEGRLAARVQPDARGDALLLDFRLDPLHRDRRVAGGGFGAARGGLQLGDLGPPERLRQLRGRRWRQCRLRRRHGRHPHGLVTGANGAVKT